MPGEGWPPAGTATAAAQAGHGAGAVLAGSKGGVSECLVVLHPGPGIDSDLADAHGEVHVLFSPLGAPPKQRLRTPSSVGSSAQPGASPSPPYPAPVLQASDLSPASAAAPREWPFKKNNNKKMKHAIIIIRAAARSPRTDTQHMARGCLPLNNSGSSSPLRFSAPSLGSHNSPPPSPCLLPGSWAGIPNILWAQLCPSRQLPPALLIARGAAGWFVFSSCFLGPFPVLSRQGGKRQAGRAGRAPLPSLCGCEDAARTHVLQVRPLTREKNLLVPAWKIPSRKEYSLRCKFTILCAENELIFPAQSTGNLFVGMNSNTSSSPGKLVPISRSREQHPRLAYPWDEWARN